MKRLAANLLLIISILCCCIFAGCKHPETVIDESMVSVINNNNGKSMKFHLAPQTDIRDDTFWYYNYASYAYIKEKANVIEGAKQSITVTFKQVIPENLYFGKIEAHDCLATERGTLDFSEDLTKFEYKNGRLDMEIEFQKLPSPDYVLFLYVGFNSCCVDDIEIPMCFTDTVSDKINAESDGKQLNSLYLARNFTNKYAGDYGVYSLLWNKANVIEQELSCELEIDFGGFLPDKCTDVKFEPYYCKKKVLQKPDYTQNLIRAEYKVGKFAAAFEFGQAIPIDELLVLSFTAEWTEGEIPLNGEIYIPFVFGRNKLEDPYKDKIQVTDGNDLNMRYSVTRDKDKPVYTEEDYEYLFKEARAYRYGPLTVNIKKYQLLPRFTPYEFSFGGLYAINGGSDAPVDCSDCVKSFNVPGNGEIEIVYDEALSPDYLVILKINFRYDNEKYGEICVYMKFA